ncbi:leucine-rich repeat-containing protein 15-like [Chironomus tepperi]|uniref:leucine-rich repeat-containing protein 15-like n=1 Tax=Chironomus tepperi TaxID=113505 RepID=UPI00391F3BBB
MDIKIFLLVFIILVKSQSSQSQTVACDFTETVNGYTCQATINNINGFDNITIIDGQHLPNKGDADVKSIISSGPVSPNIPRIFCDKFTNVESIHFLLFNIQRISVNSLWNCRNLLTLDLHMNQIEVIDQLAFINALKLTRLDLQQNKIATLPNIVFFTLSNLTNLNLGGNQLSTLNPDWFLRLSSLRYLYMHNNQIEVLPDKIFANLTRLVHIDLDNNKLKIIHADSFGVLPVLSVGSFQYNQIYAIDEKILDNTGITSFDMKGNVCADVNVDDTSEFKQVMRTELEQCFTNYLEMGDQSTTIDCTYAVTEYGYTCRASIYNPDGFNNFTTISGAHLSGYDDSNVQAIVGLRTVTTNIPKIFCDKFTNVETIFYIQLGIRSVGPESFWNCSRLLDLNIWINQIEAIDFFTFLYSPQLRRLDMRQNRIANFSRILLWPLSELKTLILEQNDLTTLNPDWFLRHWNLTYLNLQYNRIAELPRGVFGNMTALEQLIINNNRLTVIHSNSFGSHPVLTNTSFANNQINAIDERFIDNTGITNIDMRGNICANSNIIDYSPSRAALKAALRICFQNYEELYPEPTTTTTTQPTTTTPQCPVGNLEQRVCDLEVENRDLRRRIEALERSKDEF